MAKRRGSKDWFARHVSDPYVQQANADGYRSRAAYKLMQIDDKYQVFSSGARVLDCGAAPGSWSQVAAARIGKQGLIVAVDLLDCLALPQVTFIQGDLLLESTRTAIMHASEHQQFSVLLSDMAPDLSGVNVVDQAKAMGLLDELSCLASDCLAKNGTLVTKGFEGVGFAQWVRNLRQQFKQVSIDKPKASRVRSREVYVIGKGFLG